MATEFSQSVINKALAERPWIQKLNPNHYRCVPRTLKASKNRDHGKYRLAVTFDQDGLPTIESCRDERTGEFCKGFYFEGYCYHAASVSLHVLRPRLKAA